MKSKKILFLTVLLVFLLLCAGCGKDGSSPIIPTASTPAPTAEPTPTPTPVPTPIPYEEAIAASQPAYSFALDEAQITSALESAAGDADPWAQRFRDGGASMPEAPEVSRLSRSNVSGSKAVSDGNYLYLLNNKELVILSLTGEGNAVVSRTELGIDWTGGEILNGTGVSGYEKMPLCLYLSGGHLAVLYDWYSYSGNADALTYTEYTALDLYSVVNPAAPSFLSSYGQDGIYRSSSLSDGVLTVITEAALYPDMDLLQPESFMPHAYTGNAAARLSPQQVFLPGGEMTFDGFTMVGTYNVPNASRSDVKALLGVSPDVLLSGNDLYFPSPRWLRAPSRTIEEAGTTVDEYALIACTDIYHFTAGEGGLSVADVTPVLGRTSDGSALSVNSGAVELVSEICQGLYTPDSSGEPLWRSTETGICIGRLDGAPEYVSISSDAVWVGLLSGSAVYTDAEGYSYSLDFTGEPVRLDKPVSGDVILPWGESGCFAFYRSGDGLLTLSVRDSELREVASRTFGSDFSNTLESEDSYYSDPEGDIIGFAADDSYCFYGCDEERGFYFRTNVFLSDWAWNARVLSLGDRLLVADTREAFLLDRSTLDLLASFTF